MTKQANPENRADDGGFTLIEVMVGMVILSIFLAIFGGAMVSMFHSVYRTQQTSYAQSNVNIVFGKLEREVRYADGISVPVNNLPQSGDAEVEFSDTSTGSEICTELRLAADGTLMQRSWVQPQDGSTTVTMGSPVVLGTDLNPDTPSGTGDATASVAGPFARYAATGTANNQRLEIALSSQESSQVSGVRTRMRHVDVTFAALNTGTTTSSDLVCSTGRDVGRYPWPAS